MNYPAEVSFSAGNVADIRKCRAVNESTGNRLSQLARAFPKVGRLLASAPVISVAYPATLELQGGNGATMADTRLLEHHVKKSFALASRDARPLVFVAQPLAGAELLYSVLCDDRVQLPSIILWATGGYYMPVSLERWMTAELAKHGSQLRMVYSYGTAEIGHTLFAGTGRDDQGMAEYKLVADDVNVTIDSPADGYGRLLLQGAGNPTPIDTGDFAATDGQTFKIRCNPNRVDPLVMADIESWTSSQWQRRTGYLVATRSFVIYQRRHGIDDAQCEHELSYFQFCERFATETRDLLKTKPKWNVRDSPTLRPPIGP